jgi:hypothetical protein
MLRRTLRPSVLVALIGLSLVGACDVESSDGDALDDRSVNEEDPQAGRRPMPPGPPELALLRTAAESDVLDDGQRETVATVLDELKLMREDSRHAHEDLANALVQALETDTFDASAFTDQLDAIEAAAADEGDAITDGIGELHGMTSSEQRQALVDALPPPPNDMAAPRQPPPQGDTDSQPSGPPPGPPPSSSERPPMDPLLMALSLDEDQRAALQESLGAPPPPPEPPSDNPLAAFVGDDFDPDTLLVGTEHPARVRAQAEHLIAVIDTLLPLLDDQQFDRLLDVLERGPQAAPNDMEAP